MAEPIETIDHPLPRQCARCCGPLPLAQAVVAERRQVIDVPVSAFDVVEHRTLAVTAFAVKPTLAAFPPTLPGWRSQGRPMLSYIGAARSLEDVIEAWRAVHMVSVVDEQKMLLRFTDPRVLAYLPAILQASQRERICGAVGGWAYFDRRGNLTIRDIPEYETDGADIRVDQEQLGALLEHPNRTP